MQALELSNISFSYNGSRVVDGVSLVIKSGEMVSLIGPNGAGKSTLVRIAMGLLMPREGTVKLFGRTIRDWKLKELARRVSYLPQNTALPAAFNVWETVMLGRTPYLGFLGLPGEEDRTVCSQALERVDAAHLSGRKIGEISGGERQRVLLARAMAQQPDLLLLDEPTASLDLHHQVTLFNLIHDLVAEGNLTVLAVLHDLNLASAFSDRQVLMVRGKIRAAGTPGEVLNHESITDVYGENITVIPSLLEDGRPAVLPRRKETGHG